MVWENFKVNLNSEIRKEKKPPLGFSNTVNTLLLTVCDKKEEACNQL